MPVSSNAGVVIEMDCKRRETGIVLLDCYNMWGGGKGRESKRDRVGRIERDKKRVRERVRKSENR